MLIGRLGPEMHVTVGSSGSVRVASTAGNSMPWTLTPIGFGRGRIGPLVAAANQGGGTTHAFDDGALSVWYKWASQGLEQGFTISHRPDGTGHQVAIAMAASGGRLPVVSGSTSVSFLGTTDSSDLTYSGLKVTDARGHRLAAHLETSGRSIRIVLDDEQAHYPIVVDPWIQQASLAPPSTASSFGTALATSANGSTVLVGDPNGGTVGAATVYTFNGTVWSAGTPLTPPAGSASFGTSVALSGDGLTALVGDPDNGANGAATVYTYSGGSWSSGTGLAFDTNATYFGTSVALSADGLTALVGDPYGTPGNYTGPGAATIFTFDGTSWSAGTALTLPGVGLAFGFSVALSSNGRTALVGDPVERVGVRSAYSYTFNGTSWSSPVDLTAPAGATAFGTSVALSTDGLTALVGDPQSGSGGSATVYTFNGTAWSTGTALTPPTVHSSFGSSVALTGGATTAVVGDAGNGSTNTGSANIYSFNGTTWSSASPLAPPIAPGSFGAAVALSSDGSTAFVGDPANDPANFGNGAVTVYSSNWTGWSLGTEAPAPSNASFFGQSAALSGDGTTVLGADPSGGVPPVGAVSTFAYDGTTLTAGPTPTPPANANSFGTSVAVSANGQTILVGDPYNALGTATVYTRQGSGWSTGVALTPPSTASYFGTSVALSGDGTVALVGDPQGGDAVTGAVTVYNLSGNTWSAGAPLSPPPGTVAFGTTVALSADGSTALVGDPFEAGGGSVTAYTLVNASWSAGTVLAVPAHSVAFGTSVALSADGSVGLVGDPTGAVGAKGQATVFTSTGSIVVDQRLTGAGGDADRVRHVGRPLGEWTGSPRW